jgi:lysophospholipase L1-like esterase
MTDPHLGVLAFGDSITNGGGELQRGVALQSWALWTARGLGLPYTGYAVDGACVDDVLGEQIPAFLSRAADPDGPYDVGCLYIGVNDIRGDGWEPARFAVGHAEAFAFLHARCERIVCVTAPAAAALTRTASLRAATARARAGRARTAR